MSTAPARLAVVLIGHGSPATDTPPQLVGELMSLEWRKGAGGHHDAPADQGPAAHGSGDDGSAAIHARMTELDTTIRRWQRHAGNDPYKFGLERLAAALKPLLPTELFAVGYNEFCAPSIEEAIDGVIAQGASRILVIPTMLTPGGVHSEIDVPRILARLRERHPGVSIEYVWPFDLQQVAALLATHVARTAQAPPLAAPRP